VMKIMTKIDPSDINGWDWDWMGKFGKDVEAEILSAFLEVMMSAGADIPMDIMQHLAGEYASFRGAELLTGDSSLIVETQKRVAVLVEDSIREGRSIGALQKAIREDLAFSPARAKLIARTETTKALGQGNKAVALQQGRDEKRWWTQGDDEVRDEHLANEAAGWIPIADPFPDGEDTIGDPNCRCNVTYRTRAISEGAGLPARRNCPECGKALILNRDGPGLYCARCKDVKAVEL